MIYDQTNSRKSFTLIELLIVLAIVAILSVVVILTLNPAELLRQARDSNRLSDLSNLNSALGVFTTDVPGGFMGTSSIVYVSIADTISTCANLGLPTLPTGWSYNCATQANLKKNDGTGWIPVNFKQITFGSPLSNLPIDPQNTTTTAYYTYVTGGSWQLSSKLESQKYASKAALTNSYDPGLYVLGSNTNLAPFVGGLVGWWKFDDNNNSTTTDSSGYGNTGTWNGTSTSRYVAGKVGAYAGSFNGGSDYILAQGGSTMIAAGGIPMTIMAWALKNTSAGGMIAHQNGPFFFPMRNVLGQVTYVINTSNGWKGVAGSTGLSTATWYHLAIIYNGSNIYAYVNGVLDGSNSQSGALLGALTCMGIGRSTDGGCSGVPTDYFNGYIDDLRLYNRALSASEISAIYNATK